MIPTELSAKNVYRGDNETFRLIFQYMDGDTPTPFDLTIFSEIKMDIRTAANYAAVEVLGLTTVDESLEITDLLRYNDETQEWETVSENNVLQVNLNSERAKSFNKGTKYFYDIRVVGQDGEMYTWLKGELNATFNITQ